MDIDIQSRKPSLGGIFGGLSGPAIRPVALRMVYEVSRSVDIPVVGLGGISEPDHALKFLIAGACAVQVGTATFVDPMAPVKIAKGIERYLEEFEVGSLSDIVGSLIVPDGRNC
jgi:dihydroorotate dehydrogenase (NAD+) catalytic subunit